ncbi:methyl-accepting chemotaxis protein [Desulfotalea psychrophila]|uniref:Related to methyl-accepting chemotaxis protein n=1 Tax=Desulfotalea psychrophila (strain LSv54 / DSM 12343) TaxID=177439 RepID=Q6AR27_DESPS|nr:methyl-accepting chemotaxis protein [Desulfotalea psychrophila]CAG35197.1 related to methyl-accepting chemotaxis protein [Desulfotalea psychrophila LSv54]
MFNKMNLATKIGTGFGAVLVLLLLVSSVAWQGLGSLADNFVTYRVMADETNLVGRLQANMLTMRMGVKGFITTSSEKDVAIYLKYKEEMGSFLREARERMVSPERGKLVERYEADFARYDQAFSQLVSLTQKRDSLVKNELAVQGASMEKQLSALMVSAKDKGDAATGYEAAVLLRHMLLGRLYVTKFLKTSSNLDEELVLDEISALLSGAERLQRLLQDPILKKMNADMSRDAEEYLSGFKKVVADTHTCNRIISGTLAKMGPKMSLIIRELKLSLKAEQDQLGLAVQAKSKQTIMIALLTSAIALLIGLVAALLITRSITGPVGKMMDYVDVLASGDFSSHLDIAQEDEIGRMAHALNRMVAGLGTMIKEIVEDISALASASTELSAVSAQLSGNAENTSSRAINVASAAEQMSVNMSSVSAAMEQSAGNVGMVATATEEMTATVNEIAQNAAKAKNISEQAVQQSIDTSSNMGALGAAANKIGRVTETITEISEQTNLLALNATIEAARAGDAGKGFAVVANEIKDLAKQTAEATVDIRHQIEEMQKTTTGSITGIETITEVITEVNEVIYSIATAVEEQSAVSSEIAENIVQASSGIVEVSGNVAESSTASREVTAEITIIRSDSEEINQGSRNVKENAIELSMLAEGLARLVSRFKVA